MFWYTQTQTHTQQYIAYAVYSVLWDCRSDTPVMFTASSFLQKHLPGFAGIYVCESVFVCMHACMHEGNINRHSSAAASTTPSSFHLAFTETCTYLGNIRIFQLFYINYM